MAIMYPDLSEQELAALPPKLSAEVMLYRELRQQLPDRIVAMHSVDLHRSLRDGSHRDGEADFILFDPDEGILVIEVKGGKAISYDPKSKKWSSTSTSGAVNKIKDPLKQGKDYLYESILERLRKNPAWGNRRVPAGHAAFFPGVRDLRPLLGRADAAREILGGHDDLKNLQEWYRKVLAYWKGRSASSPLGTGGLKIIEQMFLQPVTVRALVSVQLEDEEQARIHLTREQARILNFIGNRRRAAITGGAGTGKTQLAVEQARRIAGEGRQTLLVCFNTPLADHLKCVVHGTKNLVVSTFESLCGKYISRVKAAGGPDFAAHARQALPGQDIKVQLAFALGKVVEHDHEARYDAIIVDEGQDFLPSFWLPIQGLLRDREQSSFCIFYDDNQSFYVKAPTFPIDDEPFSLWRNCRNTKYIHQAASGFYQGPSIDGPTIEGEPIELLIGSSLDEQAAKIHQTIGGLLKGGVKAEEIVVLVAGSPKEKHYATLTALSLASPRRWSPPEEHRVRGSTHIRQPGRILLDTVRRFKGLEAQVVFLWHLETLPEDSRRELLYVGISRAKSRLFVVGTKSVSRLLGESAQSNGST